MRNVARAAAFSLVVCLVVGVAYFATTVEAITAQAKDSQESIQSKLGFDNNSIESFDIPVEVENAEEAGAAKTFRATAYCLKGRTASGQSVRRGIVAADPRILRLGTRIHMSAGRYTGHYLVADTGGKIKGHVLDIWVPSCSEARSWGSRSVQVKVVSGGGKRKRR
ncbi:MAG: 3D domain-containing protein [Pyrinomonadaceae bacterium]